MEGRSCEPETEALGRQAPDAPGLLCLCFSRVNSEVVQLPDANTLLARHRRRATIRSLQSAGHFQGQLEEKKVPESSLL